mgnify:CR=1 FL=1
MDKITDKRVTWSMLVAAIISGLLGVFILGNVFEFVVRNMLHLQDKPIDVILPQIFLLIVLLVMGTGILLFSVAVENKTMKWFIVAFCILVPTVLEVVDLGFRSFMIYNEIMTNPEVMLSLFQNNNQ